MKTMYRAFRRRFKNFKRRALASHLMKHHGWSRRKAARATLRYLMFLYIASLHPHIILIPTGEIDRVWEMHILSDLNQYLLDCQKFGNGKTINHQREIGLSNRADELHRDPVFAQTQKLFEQYFGSGILAGDREESYPAACGRPVENNPIALG